MKMNDRELLEFAAKAAGLAINKRRQAERDACMNPDYASLWIIDVSTAWNPLISDGDALRLAVSMRLSPMMRTLGCDTADVNGTAGAYEKWGGDPYAATRRAIVRAAAEIGRQMQEGGEA
jgi:hypothetical protein